MSSCWVFNLVQLYFCVPPPIPRPLHRYRAIFLATDEMRLARVGLAVRAQFGMVAGNDGCNTQVRRRYCHSLSTRHASVSRHRDTPGTSWSKYKHSIRTRRAHSRRFGTLAGGGSERARGMLWCVGGLSRWLHMASSEYIPLHMSSLCRVAALSELKGGSHKSGSCCVKPSLVAENGQPPLFLLNLEVQAGRQLRICQNALQPRIISNCPNAPHGHIRHPTKLLPLQTDLAAPTFWSFDTTQSAFGFRGSHETEK